jgi:hypothetical protein
VVCADAEPISSSEAMAATATLEERRIMAGPLVDETVTIAPRC